MLGMLLKCVCDCMCMCVCACVRVCMWGGGFRDYPSSCVKSPPLLSEGRIRLRLSNDYSIVSPHIKELHLSSISGVGGENVSWHMTALRPVDMCRVMFHRKINPLPTPAHPSPPRPDSFEMDACAQMRWLLSDNRFGKELKTGLALTVLSGMWSTRRLDLELRT